MKNRSRFDIFSEILDAAANEEGGGGITKTMIMYKAYLSHAQLKKYLALLLENGMLDYDQTTAQYKTTEKGNRFLKTYNQINEVIERET